MARPYGEGIVFNILMKVLYIAYLAMYMAYAVLNYIAETGNDFVNFIVITFISVSIVIFVIANVLDWVYKNADARSKIKVRLHTLRNMFKIIKVGVSILVLAQTISDDSWNALTITMLVISLPTSLIWLLGEYVYVAIAGIFRRKGRKNSAEDADEEYDDAARVTPVHDTIERVKQFAESELIVLRPHEVDYDSDEQEDVNDGYLGYEKDDDFSYPPVMPAVTAQDEKREHPEYQGAFCVEEIPLEGEPLQQADTGAEREDWSIEEVIEEVPEEESAPAAEENASEDEQASQDITQEESVPAAEVSASEDEQASQDTMQEESAPAAEESTVEQERESASEQERESASEQEVSASEDEQASQDITQEESAPAAEEGTVEQERESASEQEVSASEDEQASKDATQEESVSAAEEGAAAQEESVPAAEESAPEEERESTEQEAGESAQEGSGDNE